MANVIFAPKRGRKMLFDVSDNLACALNPLIQKGRMSNNIRRQHDLTFFRFFFSIPQIT